MQTAERPRVIIVEDDPNLAFLFREVCTAAGWKVTGEADRVCDAIGLLARELPDLILIDYSLHGHEDGLELLGAVVQRWPEIYTTLITGWDIEALSARIDYVEADSILTKPLSPRVLTAHLDKRKTSCRVLPSPLPEGGRMVVPFG